MSDSERNMMKLMTRPLWFESISIPRSFPGHYFLSHKRKRCSFSMYYYTTAIEKKSGMFVEKDLNHYLKHGHGKLACLLYESQTHSKTFLIHYIIFIRISTNSIWILMLTDRWCLGWQTWQAGMMDLPPLSARRSLALCPRGAGPPRHLLIVSG